MPPPTRLPLGVLGLAALLAGCDSLRTTLSGSDPATPTAMSVLPAHSERCTEEQRDGKSYVALRDFEQFGVEQEEDVWCWAACTQMVQKFTTGKSETQKEIATRVHGTGASGDPAVKAASRYEVLCALNPDLTPVIPFEQIWNALSAQLEQRVQDPQGLLQVVENPEVDVSEASFTRIAVDRLKPDRRLSIADLRAGYPLVVGLRDPDDDVGHICVVYAAVYTPRKTGFLDSLAEAGQRVAREAGWSTLPMVDRARLAYEEIAPSEYTIHQVTVIDPVLGRSRTLTGEELEKQLDFAIAPSTARKQLEAWRKLAEIH